MLVLSGQGVFHRQATYTFKSLSLTYRQINREVCSQLYKDNEFVFLSPTAMLNYLVTITPKRREYIRSIIVISRPHQVSWDTFLVPSTCNHLQCLKVLVHRYGAKELSKALQSFLRGLECFDIRLAYLGTTQMA
jgi:hypothetical protein